MMVMPLTATLYVVARDAIGREVQDLDAASLEVLEGELTSHLDALAEEIAPGVGTYRVDCQERSFGDDSWVILIDGPKLGNTSMAGIFGRLRNGNAVVDVRGEGTYSKERLLKELDYVLAAVDESTSVYKDDDWR